MATDFFSTSLNHLENNDAFLQRHIGPTATDTQVMLETLGVDTLDTLADQALPNNIRLKNPMPLGEPVNEEQALAQLKSIAQKNQLFTSYIGMGYHDTIMPNVLLRNVLENPAWYTAYTPYQPEISQGRLEGLLNFQQMVMDLTGMEIANASMLDEGTAAAEAMAMSKRIQKRNTSNCYFVDKDTHPQTLAVVKTRAQHFGFDVVVGDPETDLQNLELFGALLQYPGSSGAVKDLTAIIETIKNKQASVTVAADIMALVLLQAPGAMGADIVVGSNQRFGIPMGMGGPHAAFFAFRDAYKRAAPGRIIGVSVDARGNTALRMAMQTREQHIRREKANSNICTSQALLAILSSFYAVYHGPEGLQRIAHRIHRLTGILATALRSLGYSIANETYFDTLTLNTGKDTEALYQKALGKKINLRKTNAEQLGISLHERTRLSDVVTLIQVFEKDKACELNLIALDAHLADSSHGIPENLWRSDAILTHPTFNRYHSETDMLRYIKRLASKDIALDESMIALGSCTMKLNATAEMLPITWPEFSQMHPFAPQEQYAGYQQLFTELETMLAACTGYKGISLQPNAGSQGEYAGLLAIKNYFLSRGETQRNVCVIPSSAHGTNPASAQMAGMDIVVTGCDKDGNVDLTQLQAIVEKYGDAIACMMITYPSTHGVYEERVRELCDIMHNIGAQVYIDGANMNALIGLAAPGEFGGDVSHLNLHKTFCIPHGGGGPGMGPIGVAEHLKPFLPGHPLNTENADRHYVISSAPWGSASILPISWMYIKMMGERGLRQATEYAILNANYVAKKLSPHFPVLYAGKNGFVAHECLLDLRQIKESTGVTEEDIAKRLMDFGFHAPTMSFPLAGTLMIEPTESESKPELDRFITAMITLREEIREIEKGTYTLDESPLHNAPHTMADILDEWTRPYSRETATCPAPWLKDHKVWPSVNRIDGVRGDRQLICTCPNVESYIK